MYDPDGVNPYGRELACQLADAGYDVTTLTAADAEWRPPGTLAVLPGNRGGSVARQAFRLVTGWLVVLWLGLFHDTEWIVVWSRHDSELLTLVARFRRLHLVVHNPGPRDTTPRALRHWAATRVVHAPSPVEPAAVVCAHPLYTHWLAWAAPPPKTPHDTLRLLLLGQRRADKGDPAAVLAALPDSVRDRVEVVVCGKGAAPDLPVRVDDRTSAGFVPDRDVARALVDCDALLAPYVGATQSGTVALAVTAGLPVLGYASGALGDLADGLVPEGDVAALAERIAAAALGDLTPPRVDSGACARDWGRLLG